MQHTYISMERPTRASSVRRPHMSRHDLGMRLFLVMWSVSFAWWPALAADPMAQHVEHPFRNLAAWLRAVSPDLRSVETKTISRGITVLSNSQNYVKSLDGMGNEIKGTISRASSTADIETEAELYESKSTRRELKKLLNLLVVVENALNAAEAAEIAAQRDPAVRARYMEDAGLEFLPEMKFAPAPAVKAVAPGGDVDRAEIERLAPEAGGPSRRKASNKSGSGRGESTRRRKMPDARLRSRLGTEVGSEDDKEGFPTELAGRRDKKPREALSVPNPSGSSPSVAALSVGAAGRAGRGGNGVTAASKTESQRRSKQAPEQTASGAKPSSRENTKKGRVLPEEQGTSRRADSNKDEIMERGNEEDSGLVPEVGDPLEAFVAQVEGAGEDGEVRCLLMLDKRDRRLVLAVGDGLVGEALMRSLNEDPAVVRLASRGSMHEVLYVNRAIFQAACDILEWAGRHIKASITSGPFEGYSMHCVGHSFGGAVAACVAGMLEGTIDVELPGSSSRSAPRDRLRGGGGQGTKRRSSRTGREGRGSRSSSRGPDESAGGAGVMEEDGEGRRRGVRVAGAAPWVGICGDKVTCVTTGCPPCLSQNLELPFVTSLVLGDDMVPRTSHESLRRLKRRLLQVIPKRKDLLSQGMAFGTSLFTDVAGVTMQGLRQATTSRDDESRLKVPGRVWFLKPRRLNNGATMEKVKQGSLRGDMLWQLRDIVLTKSMMSHHRLHRYIEVLDRV